LGFLLGERQLRQSACTVPTNAGIRNPVSQNNVAFASQDQRTDFDAKEDKTYSHGLSLLHNSGQTLSIINGNCSTLELKKIVI
jgi:hypothetical protein